MNPVRFRCVIAVGIGAILFAAPVVWAQASRVAQSAKQIPRTPDGKPDFAGFFNIPYVPNMAAGPQRTGQGTTGAVDAVSASGEKSVPYTEAGKAAYANHDAKDDPTSNCWLPGVPRIMQSPYPAQFIQTANYLVILLEYMHTFRSIPLNGRPHPENMEPAFMGDSTGHWEGDEIVVDTRGLKGAPWTWLDTAGHQHSDQLHVVETLPPHAGQYRIRIHRRRPSHVREALDAEARSYASSNDAGTSRTARICMQRK